MMKNQSENTLNQESSTCFFHMQCELSHTVRCFQVGDITFMIQNLFGQQSVPLEVVCSDFPVLSKVRLPVKIIF